MNRFSYKKLLLAFAVLGFVATAQAQEGASNSVNLSLGTVFLGNTNVDGVDAKSKLVLVPPAIGLGGEFAINDEFTLEAGLGFLATKWVTGEGTTEADVASANRFSLLVGGNYYIANTSPVTPYLSLDVGYSADMAKTKIGEGETAVNGTILAPVGQVGLGVDYGLGTVNLGLQYNFVALGGAKHRVTGTDKVTNTPTPDEGFMKKFVYGHAVALTVKMPL